MSTEENQRDRYYEFLQRILFFALLDACFHMIKNFTFQSFINSQYQKVHHALLKSVLESPINLFFDITPSGKLISRFTEDVGVYKGGLQHCINGCIDMSFWIMGILCMIFYQSKMSILFVPLFYYLVRDIFAKAK
jgi:ABC-type multidrug transport system fused ATPase/permease subunit